MKRIECIITGRVQGVFFREFILKKASSLGILGFCTNKTDGTVFVVAEGEGELLSSFLSDLQKGPESAEVERVQVLWKPATGEFADFSIV